jgi:hypothetical protein
MKFCWTRAYLLSVRCPIDSVEEERSTRGRGAQAVAQAQRKRLFEYFDYTGHMIKTRESQSCRQKYFQDLHTIHRNSVDGCTETT